MTSNGNTPYHIRDFLPKDCPGELLDDRTGAPGQSQAQGQGQRQRQGEGQGQVQGQVQGQGQGQNFNGNQVAPTPFQSDPMARQMASQGHQGRPQGAAMVRSRASQGYQAGTRPAAQGVHMVRQLASQGGQATTTTTAMHGGDVWGRGPFPTTTSTANDNGEERTERLSPSIVYDNNDECEQPAASDVLRNLLAMTTPW